MMEVPAELLSRPALAITTDTYGKTIAPKIKNHRKGFGVKIDPIKHAVRIIIEMK